MKQTIEVDLPEGYEIDKVVDPMINSGGNKRMLSIILKQKQVKDFSFYVDQYLQMSGTSTCDQISNWIGDTSLDHLANNLKQNKFLLVPWEIKIGLFRFICEQNKMDSDDIIGFVVHYKASLCAEFGSSYIGYAVSKICSYEFLSDVLDTKQNKN